MFSAFFGNYLLEKKVVTQEQLREALKAMDKTRLKLGTMAIDEGFMTIPQVEEIHRSQMTNDSLFGELALEKGYLSEEQLEELLENQEPFHLLLAQTLMDMGVLSFKEFVDHLQDYKRQYELSDENIVQMCTCDTDALVSILLKMKNDEHGDFYRDYLSLFIKSLIRFINSHVQFGTPTHIQKRSYEHLISQTIHTDTTYFTAIAGNEKDLTAFASLYANEKFRAFGEYPIDAIGEYMNQNNGLFLVNLNNQGKSIRMDLQTHIEAPTLKPYRPLYDIPIKCTSGEIHLILGLL